MLLVTDVRLGRRFRAFDVPRDSPGDLTAGVLEHAEYRAGVGARRAKEREAVLLRFRESELVRHDDALLGAVEPQCAMDPAPAHARLADRELVVVHVDRRRRVLLHHAPKAPGGQIRGRSRIGVAIRLRKFDPDEVVRALPVEALALVRADHVVRRAQELTELFGLLAIPECSERSDVGHVRILRHASRDNSRGDTSGARRRCR